MSLPLRWANTVSNPVARKRAAPPAIHGVAPGEARIVASEWADLAKDCTDWTTSAGIPGKDLSCFGGPGGAESSNIRSPAGLEGIPAALFRGGHYFDGPNAGVFFVYAGQYPAFQGFQVGFRCARQAF